MLIMHRSSDGSVRRDDLSAELNDLVRQRVRVLREQRGLSQKAAGSRVGLHQWGWSRIETGAVELRLDLLLQVQYALGLDSLESLLGDLPSENLASRFASEVSEARSA